MSRVHVVGRNRVAAVSWRDVVRRGALYGLGVVVVIAIIFVIFSRDYARSVWSVRRVEGTNLYVMDYYGDYDLERIRKTGVDPDDIQGSLIRTLLPRVLVPIANRVSGHKKGERPWHTSDRSCSTVTFRPGEERMYFGRNFDWRNDACLLLRIHGGRHTSSVAVLDLHYLGLDKEKMENLTFANRMRLLFAPYLAVDGMNEHGVAVSSMSAPDSIAVFSKERPIVMKPLMKRIILDYAHNVDEAVALLEEYRIDFDGAPCHFMIADSDGKSVVVEYVERKMRVLESPEKWQVATNHVLAGKPESYSDTVCWRYKTASDYLDNLRIDFDSQVMMAVMSAISVEDWTMWTSVYNLHSGEFKIAYRRHYDKGDVLRGRLPMRKLAEREKAKSGSGKADSAPTPSTPAQPKAKS